MLNYFKKRKIGHLQFDMKPSFIIKNWITFLSTADGKMGANLQAGLKLKPLFPSEEVWFRIRHIEMHQFIW